MTNNQAKPATYIYLYRINHWMTNPGELKKKFPVKNGLSRLKSHTLKQSYSLIPISYSEETFSKTVGLGQNRSNVDDNFLFSALWCNPQMSR